VGLEPEALVSEKMGADPRKCFEKHYVWMILCWRMRQHTLENHAIDKIGPLIRRVGTDRLEYM
jgi:hypothetical protein